VPEARRGDVGEAEVEVVGTDVETGTGIVRRASRAVTSRPATSADD